MAIDGRKVKDLISFWAATREVAESNRATVTVYSGGIYKDIVVITGAERRTRYVM